MVGEYMASRFETPLTDTLSFFFLFAFEVLKPHESIAVTKKKGCVVMMIQITCPLPPMAHLVPIHRSRYLTNSFKSFWSSKVTLPSFCTVAM